MRYSLILSLFLVLFCTSCRKSSCNYCVEGADEFVLDSYRIRQGKLAILDMKGVPLGEMPFGALAEYKDTIANGDILNIAVYHPTRCDLMETIEHINKTIGFHVRNGYVDLTDIEPIYVEGLTLDEARAKLEGAYREQVQDIELFITYRDRLTRKVELSGMVAVSQIPVDGKIRLYEILSQAKLPTDANYYTSYVLRNGRKLPVDLHLLMIEGDMDQNIVMRGGDKVHIARPEDSRVIVMGEVQRPVPVDLPYGHISLREALVEAGGIPYTGDKNAIQVIRGGLVNPKIYVLSWEHIIRLPNESLLLIPGDTVYVAEKPITSWNRFISQLLPSLGGLQSGYSTYTLFAP